jgi:hypothetical protein
LEDGIAEDGSDNFNASASIEGLNGGKNFLQSGGKKMPSMLKWLAR